MKENLNIMVTPIEQMLERLNVNSVFGQPSREGDVTVIPVAEMRLGFGYGSGYGPNREPGAMVKQNGQNGASDEGAGSGGGGGGGVTPRGYVQITQLGVRFEPIIDQTRIALASFALVAWVAFWISKTIREVGRRK